MSAPSSSASQGMRAVLGPTFGLFCGAGGPPRRGFSRLDDLTRTPLWSSGPEAGGQAGGGFRRSAPRLRRRLAGGQAIRLRFGPHPGAPPAFGRADTRPGRQSRDTEPAANISLCPPVAEGRSTARNAAIAARRLDRHPVCPRRTTFRSRGLWRPGCRRAYVG